MKICKPFEITFDAEFATVIRHCATVPRPGQSATWITSEMERSYIRLHELGFAHSVEAWEDDEYYWAADETEVVFAEAGLSTEYSQVSSCGGVYLFGQA